MMKFQVIEDNPHFVAIHKPSGMLSVPDRVQSTPSLKDFLLEKYSSIFTVHRLDRETSGLILFAKNELAHRYLSMQFENRQTVKIYNGLVHGNPIYDQQFIDQPIAEHSSGNGLMIVHKRGKSAQTAYEVLERFSSFSWLRFRIFTGRTHQIRVHMKQAGHPLVADAFYGDGKPFFLSSIKKKFNLGKLVESERPLIGRLALHAQSLSFPWPVNNELTEAWIDKQLPDHSDHPGFEQPWTIPDNWKTIEAPLPKDLHAGLQQLKKWS